MSADPRVRRGLAGFAFAFSVTGYAALAWVDWRLAVGVFLLQWAHNIRDGLESG